MRFRSNVVLMLVVGVLSAVAAPPAMAQRGGEGREGRGGRWGERGERRDRDDSDGRGAGREPAKPAAATTAPSSTSFGTVSDAARIRESATATIKQHDKSGDGFLSGEELNALGMSKAADANGDGKITHDELVAFRTPKTSSSTTGTLPTGAANTSASLAEPDSKSRKLVNDSRKSYRFKSNKERGKTWRFSDRDKNGDGQVSMSEYSRSWTDRTAGEFMRYDQDGDGMITSDEVR